MTDLACKTALDEGFAKVGDSVVIAAGVPFGRAGTTNMLRLATVWDRDRKKRAAVRNADLAYALGPHLYFIAGTTPR